MRAHKRQQNRQEKQGIDHAEHHQHRHALKKRLEQIRVTEVQEANAEKGRKGRVEDGNSDMQNSLEGSLVSAALARVGDKGVHYMSAEVDTEADAHYHDYHADCADRDAHEA